MKGNPFAALKKDASVREGAPNLQESQESSPRSGPSPLFDHFSSLGSALFRLRHADRNLILWDNRQRLTRFFSKQANITFWLKETKQTITIMVLDSLSSPHMRSQSLSFKKLSTREDLGSWSMVVERHRFLLTMLALLAFLCTIYLYFAVTLQGAGGPCSGLSGAKRALCEANSAKLQHLGKLKLF